jgi:hypothetical protein
MKNKTIEGMDNKNYCHSHSMTHSNVEKYNNTKKQYQQSYVNIQYVNQSESLPWSFSGLSGGKWCLQRNYMCR